MNTFIKIIIILPCLFLFAQVSLAQGSNNEIVRWDKDIINDADVWHKLLVKYVYKDRVSYWAEREKALLSIIEGYPNSKWVDDAAILMAGEKAIVNGNVDDAIVELRAVIEKYPKESTIINNWNFHRGCQINEAWLMWAPGLVIFNNDNTLRATFPFDKDSSISILENEVLDYFSYLEKVPNNTRDVAKYVIALMLIHKSDIEGAISELKEIFTIDNDLSEIRYSDFQASKKKYGYLIGSEPPFDIMPVWRVQVEAGLKLINLYSQIKNVKKAMEISSKLSLELSPDGWYWNVNKYLGDIYVQNGMKDLALSQYNLSIKGIEDRIKCKSIRMEELFKQWYVIKPDSFRDWKDEVSKSYSHILLDINNLFEGLYFHI